MNKFHELGFIEDNRDLHLPSSLLKTSFTIKSLYLLSKFNRVEAGCASWRHCGIPTTVCNFDQISRCLLAILSEWTDIPPRHHLELEGDDTMTCRAARMFSKILPSWIWSTAVSVVRPNLEVYWTSRTFGPHLCLNGTRSLIEWGNDDRINLRASTRPCSFLSLSSERGGWQDSPLGSTNFSTTI